MRPHSWAAFTKDAVEDARRCAPAVSLDGYAAAAGLRYEDSVRVPHVLAVVPEFAAHVFNACTGAVAPGRFGAVAHELKLIGFANGRNGARMMMPGTFHGERFRDPGPWYDWLPFVDVFTKDHTAGRPFPAGNVVVPTTSVALQVPEAALLPRFRVGSADRLAGRFDRLGDHGLLGYRLISDHLTEEHRTAVFGGPAGRALGGVHAEFVELAFVHGQLRLTRDGFVDDPAVLDALRATAAAVADGLADVATPDLPDTADRDGWGSGLDRAAAEFGLVREDPVALHRTFPRLPIPGRCRGVLRGTLPGGVDGRFAILQHTPLTLEVRSAVLLAGPAALPDSPVGGVRHEPTRMVVEARDGIVGCWSLDVRHADMATRDTTERAVAAAAALGYR